MTMPMPKPTPQELKALFRDSARHEELLQAQQKRVRRRRAATASITILLVLIWLLLAVKLLPRLHRIDWGVLFPPGTR